MSSAWSWPTTCIARSWRAWSRPANTCSARSRSATISRTPARWLTSRAALTRWSDWLHLPASARHCRTP
jgi:hypothetical protein